MKKGKYRHENIYFNENEAKVIQMALAQLLDTLEAERDYNIPFNSEARESVRSMRENARSVAKKIEKLTGITAALGNYKPGDEQEFFTKES